MHQHSPALDVVRAYLKALDTHDITTAARYLAEDIVFDSPIQHHTSTETLLPALAAFGEIQAGDIQMIVAFGDQDQALVLFDVPTGPFGALRTAVHYTVRDGKIQTANPVFDATAINAAQATQAQSAGETE